MFTTLRGNYVNPLYVESLFIRDGIRQVNRTKFASGWYVKCRTASGDEWSLYFTSSKEEAQEKLKEYAEEVRNATLSKV